MSKKCCERCLATSARQVTIEAVHGRRTRDGGSLMRQERSRGCLLCQHCFDDLALWLTLSIDMFMAEGDAVEEEEVVLGVTEPVVTGNQGG